MPGIDSQSFSVPTPGTVNAPDEANLALVTAALTAHADTVIGAHALGSEWLDHYLALGIVNAGIPAGTIGYFFEEFTDAARWQKLPGGVAVMAAAITFPGGVVEVAAGAGDVVEFATGDAVLGIPTLCPGRGHWYLAYRMKLVAVPGANTIAGLGLDEIGGGGGYVALGCDFTMHPTNWVMVISGGALVSSPSTRAVDTDWHNFECWCDGVNFYLSVDGETPIVNAGAAVAFPGLMGIDCYIDGGAAGVTPKYDKALYVFPQAA